MGVVYREHSRSFPVSGLNLSLLETELGTMRFKTVPLPIHPFFWRGFFIFRKILKIYLINTDFYLQHSSQWEARVSSGISSMLLFDWRSLCWIRDVVVYRTPIQHEWNPPLPDGGSVMVCVSSLFAYKYKHPCQSVSKRLSGTEQQNHGGHAVPFLMELFGTV